MTDLQIMAAIVAAMVVLFMWNRLPVVLVAAGAGLALWATGLLSLPEALAGYGDPAVVFIATLFVISGALERTGVTAWAGQALIAGAGEESRARLLVLIGLLVALLTALISVNGAVAALLPVVVVMAVRLKRPPSQLLMPLVFSAHAGSLLALTGTPVNVLVSDAAADAGLPAFGFFSFTIVGVPLVLGTLAIIVLFGARLLPHRGGPSVPADFSQHARTLVEQYGLTEGVFRLAVKEGSPLAGRPPSAAEPGEGLRLVTILQGDTGGRLRRPALAVGDQILVSGDAQAAAAWAGEQGLDFRPERAASDVRDTLFSRSSGLAEVIIPPRSALIGTTAFPGMITESGDLVILAIQRGGADTGGQPVTLEAGDTLLLQGTWKALEARLRDPEVVVVDSPEVVRRQAVPLGPGARQAIAVLAAMVFLLATGLLPPAAVGMLCVFALVLTGVMSVEESYRTINWTTVILVAALMPLSTAMVQTGAAELLAERLIALVGEGSPHLLLAGLFALTAILGQLISNTATALILIPIGVAAAAALGVSPLPVLMAIAIAAAAAFLTPIATPTNLMVMGPGGYAFGDYWKLGLPLMIWFGVVAVFLVPLVWPF